MLEEETERRQVAEQNVAKLSEQYLDIQNQFKKLLEVDYFSSSDSISRDLNKESKKSSNINNNWMKYIW